MSFPEIKIIASVLSKYRDHRDKEGDSYLEYGHAWIGWKTIRQQRIETCNELSPENIESKSVDAWFKYFLKLQPDSVPGEKRMSQVRQWLQGYILSQLLAEPESKEYTYVVSQPDYSKDKYLDLVRGFENNEFFQDVRVREFLPYQNFDALLKNIIPVEAKQDLSEEKADDQLPQLAGAGDKQTDTSLEGIAAFSQELHKIEHNNNSAAESMESLVQTAVEGGRDIKANVGQDTISPSTKSVGLESVPEEDSTTNDITELLLNMALSVPQSTRVASEQQEPALITLVTKTHDDADANTAFSLSPKALQNAICIEERPKTTKEYYFSQDEMDELLGGERSNQQAGVSTSHLPIAKTGISTTADAKMLQQCVTLSHGCADAQGADIKATTPSSTSTMMSLLKNSGSRDPSPVPAAPSMTTAFNASSSSLSAKKGKFKACNELGSFYFGLRGTAPTPPPGPVPEHVLARRRLLIDDASKSTPSKSSR